jgi:hypothetical protein
MRSETYKPVIGLVVVAAINVIAGCGREAPVSNANPLITYVDAKEGPSGNTTLDTGDTFTALTAAPVRSDNLWTMRLNGNGGTVFTSNDIGGQGSEDAPALMTTVRGLEPDSCYEMFAYFWSDRHNWQLKASLAPFRHNDSGPSFSKEATESSTIAPPAVEADFDSVVLVTESNRTMHQADVGEAIADANGEVRV